MNKSIIFEQNIEVQKIYKDLNFNMNKKEDDLKNLINEKDLIIQEMDKKLQEQEKIIYKNKYKIKTLNEKLNQVVEQLKEFKAIEVEIKNLLKYNKSNISLNSDLNLIILEIIVIIPLAMKILIMKVGMKSIQMKMRIYFMMNMKIFLKKIKLLLIIKI